MVVFENVLDYMFVFDNMFRNKVPQQGAALAPDSVSGARQWRNIATEHCRYYEFVPL